MNHPDRGPARFYLVALLALVVTPVAQAAGNPAPYRHVIAYFPSWAIWSDRYRVEDVPADEITQLNYAFAVPSASGGCVGIDPDADRINFPALAALKAIHPHLVTVISVGGSDSAALFSSVAATDQTRAVFAASCVGFMTAGGFDGIDVDWEFPSVEERDAFTALLRELRRRLDAQGSADGKRYVLTTALPAGRWFLPNVDLGAVAETVDSIGLMTYDFYGSWSSTTGFNSPLHVAAEDPRDESVETSVEAYLGLGVPPGKLVVGVPFYGYGFSGVWDVSHGLFQPFTGPLDTGSFTYRDVVDRYLPGMPRLWHETAKVPWLFDPAGGRFLTYDDPLSMSYKSDFVSRRGLGGVMVWHIAGDDDDRSLLDGLLRPFSRAKARSWPSALDFGQVAVGGAADLGLTVRNDGSAPLSIRALASDAPSFRVVGPSLPLDLAAGQSQEVGVRYSPSGSRLESGRLLVVSNGGTRRTLTVPLAGSGGPTGDPGIEVSPSGVHFGAVAVGGSRSLDLVLRNPGGRALQVQAIRTDDPAFAVMSAPAPLSVPAGGESALSIRFAPATAGARTAALRVESDAQGQPVLTVPLAGEGVDGPSAAPCTYAVGSSRILVGAAGGSPAIPLEAGPGCRWTAVSLTPFVQVDEASRSGSENGTVRLLVAANEESAPREGSLTVAGLPVTVAQEGAANPDVALVPIVLAVSGAGGASYTSELTLTNRGATDAVIELTYTAAFGAGSGRGLDVLPAGAQVTHADALAYLAALGLPIPGSGNRGGSLRVNFTGSSSRSAGSVTVRTVSVLPDGRAGLAYAGVPRDSAPTGPVVVGGLRQDARDRSNLAVVNFGDSGAGNVTLRLTVFSGDPADSRSFMLPDVELSPGGFLQFSGILSMGTPPIAQGYVRIERIAGSAPFYAYGVINDQGTSDGSFLAPVPVESGTACRRWTVPVAVETSSFQSELVVTNWGPERRTFRFRWVADAIATPDATARFSIDAAPGEQVIIPALVSWLRARGVPGIGSAGPSFAGPLFAAIEGTDGRGLSLGARTSTTGADGRYGLFTPALSCGEEARRSAWLLGLRQDAETRTNLAITNVGEPGESDDTFAIDLHDGASGRLTATVEGLTLAPGRTHQIDAILSRHAPGVSNGYARVRLVSGTSPFHAYAVVNDGGQPGERTGDGAFVAMTSVDVDD